MRIFSFINRLIKNLTNFLFPKSPRVIELEALSSAKLIEVLPRNFSQPDGGAIALFDYSNSAVKEVVWEVKYAGNRVLADRLGEIFYDVIMDELLEENLLLKWHSAILIPIPISDKRRFERGWNQTELLASATKKRDGAERFKYLPRELVKVEDTLSQTKTSGRSERRRNLENSMKILNPEAVAGQCVVLIDDVVTTGSTFHEAKRVLKEAGAKRVLCFALAH